MSQDCPNSLDAEELFVDVFQWSVDLRNIILT